MTRAIVAGVGMIPFKKPDAANVYVAMGSEAARRALADSGLAYTNIQQAYVGYDAKREFPPSSGSAKSSGSGLDRVSPADQDFRGKSAVRAAPNCSSSVCASPISGISGVGEKPSSAGARTAWASLGRPVDW